MTIKIKKLLDNAGGNYLLPFFWQHGEDEATLRKYMKVIDESNCKAVCVESRPHPDFCGPDWWRDMDIILDEARKRDMKVWILDDSHFPTGFANGALDEQPPERCRQGICCRTYDCTNKAVLEIDETDLMHPDSWEPNQIESYIGDKNPRKFDDDKLLGLYAVKFTQERNCFNDSSMQIDLSPHILAGQLKWNVPAGNWKVYALHLTRNRGYHRNYINMMDRKSCQVLIDAVYEPHYKRYKEEFGKTIAGFFSDEPELGNGHMYEEGLIMGDYSDLPWSASLEQELKEMLGEDYVIRLPLLWEQAANEDDKARMRYAYMDAVTRLVQKDFSEQLGGWCRDRGVQYIGHIIEDNNQHARLGSSLGHYYRGLAGQDMAGIDDIGGQVMPQQEEVNISGQMLGNRQGEFYHYMLGKLASSFAAIDPLKKGNSVCEIFGNYGWECGVRLEKYLVDHFLVRGINHYVPHAFSPKEYPDPDCPPHFYAQGNNPQYRHFGALMAYTNRVCELISQGRHIAPVAVLYHGEAEWTGNCMFSHEVGHLLADNQIEYDYIPQDVFAHPDVFHTVIDSGKLKVNTQEYSILVIPEAQYITEALALAVSDLKNKGIPVVFINKRPQGICNAVRNNILFEVINRCPVIKLGELMAVIGEKELRDIQIEPENSRIRYLHYVHDDDTDIYIIVNEGKDIFTGEINFNEMKKGYGYDAWANRLYDLYCTDGKIALEILPLESLIVVFSETYPMSLGHKTIAAGQKIDFNGEWKRSICRSIDYPRFKSKKKISLPDNLTEEEPEFSGFVQYENRFSAAEKGEVILKIENAHEGVEVFVNEKSQGIQIVPPFIYDISKDVLNGENELRIEVATTLEREMAKIPDRTTGQFKIPKSLSGITGSIDLYLRA